MSELLAERYELGRVIGAGGMAKVHLATDRFLDRPVAVKVLDDAAARSADPAARERFLNEARSAAGFAHHNAVSVYDAGQDDGVLYIVMEYVAGDTLAARLARETILPIGDAVTIVVQILEALGAMHESGLLHRDVKPANVLLTETGRVKLTDFGIAKRLDEIDEALTSAGTVVGTPRYLSPEQAVGGELRVTTDIYLVGIVLHEILTGERPPSALLGVPSRSPDPRRLRAGLPDELAEVVIKALEYRPDHRWPDAPSMASALRAAVDGLTWSETTATATAPRDEAVDTGTRTIPVDGVTDDRTQAIAAADAADDDDEVAPADTAVIDRSPDDRSNGELATGDATASFATGHGGSGRSWSQWIPIAAIVLLVGIVGFAALSNRAGDDVDGAGDGASELEQLTGDEFLAALRADPSRFGERGPEVRDRLDELLAITDARARAEAREALEVDVFVWVSDGELDVSVGQQIARVLDG